jgi:hypothetical protein
VALALGQITGTGGIPFLGGSNYWVFLMKMEFIQREFLGFLPKYDI